MKKFNFYFVTAISFYCFNISGMSHQEKYSHHVRMAASGCVLAGGWGFFAVNSPRYMNRLSYSTKRIPLGIFLAGCSVNQGFVIAKNIKKIRNTDE
jgi:hypothetical protein